jgi:peptide/nickel transport system ATP-binding protein
MAGSGTAHLREEDALLRVENLKVEFKTPGGTVQAVSGVTFDVLPGETLGIVGESGCGKSTMGRAVLRLDPLTGGRIVFDGQDITALKGKDLRALRRRVQMVFQDPVGSLNPRRQVRDLVTEGLAVAKAAAGERRERARSVMASVALPFDRFADRRPRQLSGGQAQRVAIARAIAVRPSLLVCDEAVSALDVSVQAQIINLLEDIKEEFSLTVVFIAHDLGVVKTISDRVLVMYLGKVCEFGEPEAVYRSPAHPYTRVLLDSVPDAKKDFTGPALTGDVPSPVSPPSGCRFRTRCPRARDLCAQEEPEIRPTPTGQFVACHFPLSEGTPNR